MKNSHIWKKTFYELKLNFHVKHFIFSPIEIRLFELWNAAALTEIYAQINLK